MFKRYLLRSLPEWLLCTAAAASLCGNLLEGFILPEELYTAWLPMTLWTMALMTVLYLLSYSRKSLAVGIPLLILAAVAAVLLCGQMGISLLESTVAEDNTGLWYLVVLVTALVSFALTRTIVGCGVFCSFGALANGWIALSLYPNSIPCLLIFLVSGLSLLAVCRYRRSMLQHSTQRSGSLPMAGISLAAAGLSVLMASGIWFGVLADMELPTLDITLLTNIVSIEVLERIGVSKTEILLNERQDSNDLDEDFDALTDEQEEEETQEELEEQTQVEAGGDNWAEEPSPQGVGAALSLGVYGLISQNPVLAVLLGLLLLLLLVGLVWLFLSRHRLWLARMQKKHPQGDAQVEILYHWIRSRLPLLGLPSVESDTPMEYAQRIQRQTALLDQEGASWLELSECFCRLCYGGISVTPEELSAFLQYHKTLLQQARRLCGFKYLWRQFLL